MHGTIIEFLSTFGKRLCLGCRIEVHSFRVGWWLKLLKLKIALELFEMIFLCRVWPVKHLNISRLTFRYSHNLLIEILHRGLHWSMHWSLINDNGFLSRETGCLLSLLFLLNLGDMSLFLPFDLSHPCFSRLDICNACLFCFLSFKLSLLPLSVKPRLLLPQLLLSELHLVHLFLAHLILSSLLISDLFLPLLFISEHLLASLVDSILLSICGSCNWSDSDSLSLSLLNFNASCLLSSLLSPCCFGSSGLLPHLLLSLLLKSSLFLAL